MDRYAGLVKQRLEIFTAWKLEHITRNSNERTDALAAVVASIPIKETIFPPNLLSTGVIYYNRLGESDR